MIISERNMPIQTIEIILFLKNGNLLDSSFLFSSVNNSLLLEIENINNII